MKFRIIRDYDEFQPQVWHITSGKQEYWENIGHHHCYTLEEAEKVCRDYKLMHGEKVVEEFEL